MMKDSDFMRRALELSRKGNPSPNPYVGAVIVKNGRIIGEGYHRRAGMPHAEVEALRKCANPRGATLYVTLEPCSHHGRTPPCTDAILDAGISKVVYGMRDPNPLVSGGRVLRRAGVEVVSGVLSGEVERLNEVFVKHVKTGMPFVTLKSGMTLDGKIATSSGESKWITSPESRRMVQELRGGSDAILVGINTVLMDDPSLTCRLRGWRDPIRVIMDSRLRIPLDAKVLKDDNVIIATSKRHGKKKEKLLEGKARVWVMGDDHVDFRKLMRRLGKEGVTSVLIEGGGEVNASALKSGLVDRMLLFMAPTILCGRETPAFGGEGAPSLSKAFRLDFTDFRRMGRDLMIEARPAKS
ncbi:MAG: bifunctional diaminohydroxyphosphoribosylaminopyrimidine deaminase/5-amino-6-(5-phosphoribosylamino)uracil reductase RibD [Candidatus Altiarchaeota archaeon]